MQAHEYIVAHRHRKKSNVADSLTEKTKAYPAWWICGYCQDEKNDNADCFKDDSHRVCYHCGKIRPPLARGYDQFHERWYCPAH